MKKPLIYLSAFCLLLCFMSCSGEEEASTGGGSTDATASILGEWFQDASSDMSIIIGTTLYKADGTFDSWYANVDPETNYYFNYSGKYTYTQNSYTVNYVSPFTGNTLKVEHPILKLTRYDFVSSDPVNSTTAEAHRIIDTYNLKVGEAITFKNSDVSFHASAFTTSEKRIATVDTQGNIKAHSRGTAFISAKSSIGTAVVRVVVTDSNNAIDDFLQYMGEPINNTITPYGTAFDTIESDEGTTARFYNLQDEMVESVYFHYGNDNRVKTIFVYLREGADQKKVVESFDKKYHFVTQLTSTRLYVTEKNGQMITISWSPGTVIYTFDTNPYEQFDDLIALPLEQIANRLEYSITAEDWENGYFIQMVDNQVFDFVLVVFDEQTHDVKMVILFCNEQMKQTEVEEWYREHYYSTDIDEHTYGQTEAWAMGDFTVSIETDDEDNTVSVTYLKN